MDVADAAYNVNKSGQVLLASRLLDVDCILLQVLGEITAAAMPYAKAWVSGVMHSAVDLVHAAAHPIETAQGLGKAIYYVLETAALNSYSESDGFEDIYIPLRDQRNAEIVAGLKNLGDKIADSSGPEIFEALVQFGSDFVVPGKVIHAVGGVCGALKAEANIARAAELVVGASEQVSAEKIGAEVAKTVQKMEQVAQEKIVQTVAEELMNAEKQIEKVPKSSITQKIKRASDAPPAVDMRSLLDKNLEIAENAIKDAERIKKFPDGRVRYYEAETLSSKPGPTRGSSYVTEFDTKTGRVRSWQECYDHVGNVNRVHPKTIDGFDVVAQHYPLTKAELELLAKK